MSLTSERRSGDVVGMRGRLALAVCAVFVIGSGGTGCAPADVALTVRVQSGLRAADELRHVRVVLRRGGSCADGEVLGSEARGIERRDQSALAAGSLSVAEFRALAPEVYAVQLLARRPGPTGFESGAVLIERCVVTSIASGRVLRIALTTGCVGVSCPALGGSPAFSECLNGRCVDPRCDPDRPETLLFCCDRDALGADCDDDPGVCRGDDDCERVADCVSAPTCSDGVCVEPAEDTCGEGEHCDVVAEACVPDDPILLVDAGSADASVVELDSGVVEVDAGVEELDAFHASDAGGMDAGEMEVVDAGRRDAGRRTDAGRDAAPSGPCAGQPAGTMCRASAGDCDVVERCDGTSAACPSDGFASSSTVCRAAVGACDATELCTGSSAACPTDLPAPAGACGGMGSYCDGEGRCCAPICTGVTSCSPICGMCGGDLACQCMCCGGSFSWTCV